MEGQKLERNHTQNALETVNRVGQLDGFICELGTLGVILGTQDDWTTLKQRDRLKILCSERSKPSRAPSRVSGIFWNQHYCSYNVNPLTWQELPMR